MAKYVGSTGPKDADIMILGEAPGKKEAKVGKPFVGKSGKLLTRLLHKAGILRDGCYISNVIKERPPGNDISRFIDLSRKYPHVTPGGESYLNSLRQELTEVDPNLIIAVGNVPLWALTKNRGITKWRGSVLENELGQKVLPTIHPAAALRQYIFRYYILFDLKRAKKESTFPEIKRTERKYIIAPTLEEVMTYLDACRGAERVAFDIEVSGTEVSCVSFSCSKEHAISIPFQEGFNLYWTHEQEKAIWLAVAGVLEDENVEKIAHNATFDVTYLYRKYGIKTRPVHDTMIAQGILYPDFKKGLGFVTTQYTDIPYYKDEGKDKFEAGADRGFWLYNAKDSIVLQEALSQQIDELGQQGNTETYDWQRKLVEPLVAMTEYGMNVDVEGMQAKSDELEQKIREKEILLNQHVGWDINPRSVPQLKEYFYGSTADGNLGLDAYKSRSTGRPTTNEKAMKRLSRRGFKAAELILDIRGLEKLRGTYLEADLHDDGRLRSFFNPIGTSTGRLSSSKDIHGKGMNVQNLPPAMKEFIQPDPGFCMYEVDLGQAENRIVAYMAPDVKMIDAFQQGRDIHSQTAALIFDMEPSTVEEFSRRYKQGDKSKELLPDIGQGDKTHRAWGKQANHAFNYGMGYRKASLNWEIPENDAKFIYNQYHKVYPGVEKMHRWIDQQLSDNRTVTNLFGRKRRFLGRWNRIKKDAYAYPAQSSVADIINRYGVCGIYYNQEELSDVVLLSQVHDSIWFQLPLDIGWDEHHRLLKKIKEMLEPTLTFRGREFMIPAEITMLPNNARFGYEFAGLPSSDELKETYESLREQKEATRPKEDTSVSLTSTQLVEIFN